MQQQLKAKSVFAMSDVEMTISVVAETEKAVKANIQASFIDMGEKHEVEGTDVWIPKYIMEKKQAAKKIGFVFAEKQHQLREVNPRVKTLEELQAQVEEIEYQHGYVNEDAYTLQIRGIRASPNYPEA